MQVHLLRLPSEVGKTHWRFCCSDLHLGSPNVDVRRIKTDLDTAKRIGARVLINGDVFDAIGRHDKRSDAATLVKELRASKDLLRDTVAYARGVLGPYADIIDVIGIGNHEETWVKYNEFDPVAALIDALNSTLREQGSEHQIRHGGICGYVVTRFTFPSNVGKNASARHTLFYHHGSGGDAPVTKGMIDFSRKMFFVADAVTVGHRHSRFFDDDAYIFVSESGLLTFRERKSLQTGSYYRNYLQTKQSNPLDYSYAESKAHRPKPVGGLFLALTPERLTRTSTRTGGNATVYEVRQDVVTSPTVLLCRPSA